MPYSSSFTRIAPFVLALAFSQTAVARIYVAEAGGSTGAVTDYPLAANGNSSPAATITGGSTGLVTPYGVAADASHVYVTDIGAGAGSVYIYGLTAAGNASPLATISGASTGLDSPEGITVDANRIYVTNNNISNSVTVYPLAASGNTSPTATIRGNNTGLTPVGIAVDASHIYVTNNSSVTVYPLNANGNVAPTATISGGNTGLTAPTGIAVDANHIYVANGNSILEFALTANGNVAPTATISGSSTGLNSPFGVAVNASHIFVSNDGSPNSITVYTLTATGNAAPSATIRGSATGLNTPLGIAVIQDPVPFTWAPAAITYPTALSSAQLDVLTSVPGNIVYSQLSGAVLHPGTYTLTATLTPTDTVDYLPTQASVQLTVNKAVPVITWATPASITYGTALSGTQLNASASFGSSPIAGTFAYTPLSGTKPHAGNQSLHVTFTPTDTTDYSSPTDSVTITVNKAVPVITWAAPASITYGMALSGTQLNASASFGNSPITGTFAYTPLSGTKPHAGSQTLSVTFTPTDTTDYTSPTDSVRLTVNKAAPLITWPAPAAIAYGTALSSTQLDAVAKVSGSPVAGTFAYSPLAGTKPHPGNQTLGVTFTPTDTTDYTSRTDSVQLTVNKVAPVITWSTPAAITYGTALSATQLNASATFNSSPVAGTFAYSPLVGTMPHGGNQTLSVTFTPTDTTDYTSPTDSVQLTVNKATPLLAWPTPAAILYGTALSSTQLDAVAKFNGATVAGTFAYSPLAGTLPPVGNQTLKVTFTPTDATDYATATSSVALMVSSNGSPTATISGDKTDISQIGDVTVDAKHIFVTNSNTNSVTVYALNASGNVAPTVTISGGKTGLDFPTGIAVDSSHIYVTNYYSHSVTVYPLDATGDVAPIATISGDKTGFDGPVSICVNTGHIYVANNLDNSITVYPLDATGDAAPTATIKGGDTHIAYPDGIAVNSSGIYIANYTSDSVTVYALDANGNAAPTAIISGPKTGLSEPLDVKVDATHIFVANYITNSILIYPLTANGNVAPSAAVSGGNTGLDEIQGIAVDASSIYAANYEPESVTVYALSQFPALTADFVAGALAPQPGPVPALAPEAPNADAPAVAGAQDDASASAAIPGASLVLGGAPMSNSLVTDLVGGEVSAGSPLIGRFTVAGNAPRRFLIWAVAPSLDSPGMDDPLPALSLAVFDSSGRNLAQSDPWHTSEAGASDLATAEAGTGVLPLPSGSKDSAVIVTLAPGNYTAVASGVGNTAGTVLVEIYEIP